MHAWWGAQAPTARGARAAGVLATLRSEGLIAGWRDELYPVAAAFGAPPHCLVERAAAPHFGIKAYGAGSSTGSWNFCAWPFMPCHCPFWLGGDAPCVLSHGIRRQILPGSHA